MQDNLLYRGLHDDEIKAMALIPKKSGLFLQDLMTPFETPARTGTSRENAGRHHERYNNQSPGVSTTTSYKAAIRYATNKGSKDGVVAVINRDKLAEFNIYEEDPADTRAAFKPDDNEIILFDDIGGQMPTEIIVRLHPVKSTDWNKEVK